MTEGGKEYRWSSIEFSGRSRNPVVWCHPKKRKPGTPDGIALTFGSAAEMRELVETLRGALMQRDLNAKARRKEKREAK